ncbi:D-alanyl-D-alanine carboxypeptidase family protein [Alkaliphilus transvaalensis]|uniref:D-alanyl-D-alanine carboxypeptidase family protein n=1 Tax=Alkaliphilus transvaalensis TaxID=114628 RepID=UPI0004798C15|nr:D-alanyl-D-alanine carboxypeptidase family protein [Alkaliphilus transvaalensis]
MKKTILTFLSLVILISMLSVGSAFATPQLTAPNAILMDYQTGEILYEHNAREVTFPASTTKVLTAILVMENANLSDVVTVGNNITVGGASMYLLPGESFTVEELLHALLIRSANDVAEVLAIHVSGSVEEFVKLMNTRAKELGATDTNFTNPHGMPDPEHVTTAYDLALIGRYAMSFPLYREIIATVNIVFDETEQTPEKRYYRNSNRFLWGTGGGNRILYNGRNVDIKYDLIEGGKTGYTVAAQQCLVSSAMKEDHRLISVVLGAQGANIYLDTRTLIDYGYENFKSVPIVEANLLETEVPVTKGLVDTLSLYTESNLYTVLPIDQDPSAITREVVIEEKITAPINTGDSFGKIIYSLGDKILGEVNLIATVDIEVRPSLIKSSKPVKYLIIFAGVFILWKLLVLYIRVQRKRRRFGNFGRRSSLSFSKSLYKRR